MIERKVCADLRRKLRVQLTTRVQERNSPDPYGNDYPVLVHQVCEPAHRMFLYVGREYLHISAEIPGASLIERIKMSDSREEQKWLRPESWSTYVE
jgi:hypothetical protein